MKGRHPDKYDSEPVRYCSRCYSLKIRYEEALGIECCADCGCSDILETSIENWEEKYRQRYGHQFVVKNEDPKKTFIFRLSPRELRERVFKSELWRKVIYTMYPKFPGGWGRADSVFLFFDKLIKDNRLDDLRMLLLKWKI